MKLQHCDHTNGACYYISLYTYYHFRNFTADRSILKWRYYAILRTELYCNITVLNQLREM